VTWLPQSEANPPKSGSFASIARIFKSKIGPSSRTAVKPSSTEDQKTDDIPTENLSPRNIQMLVGTSHCLVVAALQVHRDDKCMLVKEKMAASLCASCKLTWLCFGPGLQASGCVAKLAASPKQKWKRFLQRMHVAKILEGGYDPQEIVCKCHQPDQRESHVPRTPELPASPSCGECMQQRPWKVIMMCCKLERKMGHGQLGGSTDESNNVRKVKGAALAHCASRLRIEETDGRKESGQRRMLEDCQ